MSEIESGCGVWNGPHICRLPVDDGHAGDHRCVGCGDVWNQGPDDHDDDFTNDYDGPLCEERGQRYMTEETPEERRTARLLMGSLAHDALTTTKGVRGHAFGRDRTGEPPCRTCDAIERETAALVALGVMIGPRSTAGLVGLVADVAIPLAPGVSITPPDEEPRAYGDGGDDLSFAVQLDDALRPDGGYRP